MGEEKKYNGDVRQEAENLAKLISTLPKEKAESVTQVANAYLDGVNACIRLFTVEENGRVTA